MNDKYCILQDDLKDCGVCSLLSIIRYYHGDASKEYLREITRTDSNGVNALNILKASRYIGFLAYGVKGTIKEIDKKMLPLISHVIIDKKYPHFVVIYKINLDKNKILVMDPAKGFINITVSEFENISTNYYLILKPKHLIPKIENNSSYFEKIGKIILNHKLIFLSIIIMSLFYTIINIINSYHFKLLYESDNSIKMIFALLIIITIIKHMINYYRNYLLVLFNTLLDKYLVKDALYHIINLPYLYYRNHTNGDLLSRINDLGNVKELLSNLFVSIFVDLTLAIIILIFMLDINIVLTIVTSLSLGLYGIISFVYGRFINKCLRDNLECSSLVNNHLVESLTSFETIKNLSLQNYIFNAFARQYDQYSSFNMKLYKKIQREMFAKNIVLDIFNIIVIYLGIMMIFHEKLTVISLITFLSLSNYLISPIKKLLDLHLEYQNGKESIRRIKEIYQIPCERLSNKDKIKYLSGNIIIDNLTYSYDSINNIFSNLSLEIAEGDKVLIYGDSGCGKSTLIKLLIKYIDDNYQGNITIGGYDLKNLSLLSLRKNICYVSQNEFLYTQSIYDNITLGKKIAHARFLDIAKNLKIDDIVKKSVVGYNLVIENNGENLSGGERKRIIVARSLLQRANIYIYDETFSEMDILLERKILSYLFKLYPDKTFIIISHRFSNEDLFNQKIRIGGEM